MERFLWKEKWRMPGKSVVNLKAYTCTYVYVHDENKKI